MSENPNADKSYNAAVYVRGRGAETAATAAGIGFLMGGPPGAAVGAFFGYVFGRATGHVEVDNGYEPTAKEGESKMLRGAVGTATRLAAPVLKSK